MRRTRIINSLIKYFNYNTYLEIGVSKTSLNFEHIKISIKHGVDPKTPLETYTNGVGYKITSDEFFNTLNSDTRYDIIFIDGLHVEEQVDRDIDNSLKHLSENGTIVMHDCYPPSLLFEEKYRCGNVWRSFFKKRYDPTLSMFCIDSDFGVGIIRKGTQTPLKIKVPKLYDYSFFEKNKTKILNLKSPQEFSYSLQSKTLF